MGNTTRSNFGMMSELVECKWPLGVRKCGFPSTARLISIQGPRARTLGQRRKEQAPGCEIYGKSMPMPIGG